MHGALQQSQLAASLRATLAGMNANGEAVPVGSEPLLLARLEQLQRHTHALAAAAATRAAARDARLAAVQALRARVPAPLAPLVRPVVGVSPAVVRATPRETAGHVRAAWLMLLGRCLPPGSPGLHPSEADAAIATAAAACDGHPRHPVRVQTTALRPCLTSASPAAFAAAPGRGARGSGPVPRQRKLVAAFTFII